MAFTQADLDNVDKAIKTGRMTVEYDGRRVTYRSVDELVRLKGLIEEALGQGKPGPRRRVAEYYKGTT